MRDLLYHYTTEAGLTGIIESGNIRATHIHFLNDWTEFREALAERYVRVLLDAFRAGLPGDLPEEAISVIDGMVSKRATEILAIIAGSELGNETFVCSFTSASPQETGDPGDRLSQWRGYAGGTQGFSLGFDKALLQARVEKNAAAEKTVLQQCIYQDAEKIELFVELGRFAASWFAELRRRNAPVSSSFKTILPEPSEEYKKSSDYFILSLSQATARFFTTAPRIKNIGFREEGEWRVIHQATKAAISPKEIEGKRFEIVKFRDGQFGRTPYIEIPLQLAETATSPLCRIVVGPGPRQEQAKRMIELLLLNRGIEVLVPGGKGVEIATSLIPFRSA